MTICNLGNDKLLSRCVKTSYLSICLDATTFILISAISLIETICLKICPGTTAQEWKKSTSGGR